MFVSSDDADLTPAFTIIISPKVHTPLTRPGEKHLLTRPDVGGGVGLKKEWCGDYDKSTSLGTFRALEYVPYSAWLRSEARLIVCHRLALKQSPSLSPWMLEHQTNTMKRTCSCCHLRSLTTVGSAFWWRFSAGALSTVVRACVRQIGLITVPRII